MRDTTQTPKRLTRKQINEGLDTVPISGLLGGSSRELTAKQKKFAREVALGATKADAYRKHYNVTSKATMTSKPYALASDDRVKAEIDAIKRAQEAEHLKNPLALRSLVISTLVELATNPDAKDAVRLQAVKILGGVTEVAAFTERKETKVITSSTDARAEVLAELRALANAQAADAQIIDAQASELLDELKAAAAEPHPSPAPTDTQEESLVPMHTIPQEPTSQISSSPQTSPSPKNPDLTTPPPQSEEDPRHHFWQNRGRGATFLSTKFKNFYGYLFSTAT
jgi:Tfp pilus assembly protein PilN